MPLCERRIAFVGFNTSRTLYAFFLNERKVRYMTPRLGYRRNNSRCASNRSMILSSYLNFTILDVSTYSLILILFIKYDRSNGSLWSNLDWTEPIIGCRLVRISQGIFVFPSRPDENMACWCAIFFDVVSTSRVSRRVQTMAGFPEWREWSSTWSMLSLLDGQVQRHAVYWRHPQPFLQQRLYSSIQNSCYSHQRSLRPSNDRTTWKVVYIIPDYLPIQQLSNCCQIPLPIQQLSRRPDATEWLKHYAGWGSVSQDNLHANQNPTHFILFYMQFLLATFCSAVHVTFWNSLQHYL